MMPNSCRFSPIEPDSVRDVTMDQRYDTLTIRASPDPRSVAGTYRLLGRIGAGATGIVYEGEHVRLGRRVAIKILRTDMQANERAVERFFREARIIATVQDEHVVSILDCGQLADGTPFLVTELLQGQSLRSRLGEAKVLSLQETVQIVLDACLGLSAVHASGIIHRDIKPENLFLTRRSSGAPVCKVLDFGVAKLTNNPTTEHGAIIGTVSYMAPEQILDASQVGPQADVYSMGAILFECLVGQPPHTGDTTHAIMFKAVHSAAPDLQSLRPEAPSGLARLLERALSGDPKWRFATAAELADALARVAARESIPVRLAGTTLGQPESLHVPLVNASSSRRPRLPRLRSAALGALVGAAASWVAFAWRPSSPDRASVVPPVGSRSGMQESMAVVSSKVPALQPSPPEDTTPAEKAIAPFAGPGASVETSRLAQDATSPRAARPPPSHVRSLPSPSAPARPAPTWLGFGAAIETRSPYESPRPHAD